MKENIPPKSRRLSLVILGLFVLISLTVLVLLQTSNPWRTLSIETASETILLYALSSLNFFALITFGFIFLRSIIKLARERRSFQLGSKIKTRLLLYFVMISLLPIIAMAVFSYLFMNRALDRWFTLIPENVVREARFEQTKSAADQAGKLHETAQMLAQSLEGRKVTDDELRLIAEAGELTRIEVVSNSNETIAGFGRPVPKEYEQDLKSLLATARAGVSSGSNSQAANRFDVAVAAFSDGRRLLIVPEIRDKGSVGQIVDNSLAEFDRLKEKQATVRQIGLLTLGLLTFLLIFASTWIAFYVARGFAGPIKALAEGADEIAQGNLAHRVDVLAEDELALLVNAFNQMSGKLEENSAEIGERRRYIETVLQSLPTGVVSIDSSGRVSTMNAAAKSILMLEDADFSGIEFAKVVNSNDFAILGRVMARARRVGRASEQTVLTRDDVAGNTESERTVPVALTATALPNENGAVLVIEDLSELISAQRAAAWQEVARRMAHEIKNPLTPIQLSAERIAKRFDGIPAETPSVPSGLPMSLMGRSTGFEDQTSKVVKDGTETILREVRSLKSMVDEFSRFARLPDAKLEPGNLNEIVSHVAELYEDRLDSIKIDLNLAAELPETLLDAEQIKRVFVNLIDNAIEALGDSSGEKKIDIRTRHDSVRDIVVAEVADNGRGIEARDFQRLFQPYFSTKGRGTGLGLAIVHRIIIEHQGKISAVANTPKGAKFIVEIPVIG